MRAITFLVFFLSLGIDAIGQGIWPAYTEMTSEGVTIQNSFPKGGSKYFDSNGKGFAYAVFWTRVVNTTANALELTINFPADSFPVSVPSGNYLKLFLPPDTMTLGNVSMFNYGLDLESFLDKSFYKATSIQRTINPKEEYVFYVAALSYSPYSGAVRAGFDLEGKDLLYKINILHPERIPCGNIIVKK